MNSLNGSFTETPLVTHDDSATVVLHGCGENLTCRGAEAVHHDHHWTGVGDAWVLIDVVGDISTGILGQNHRAALDKKPAEIDGFLERSATVLAQVDHEPLDIFFLQTLQKRGDIGGGAFGFPASTHVRVKGGQGNPTDAGDFTVRAFDIEQLGLGFLILELDFVARDLDDGAIGGIVRITGNDLQANRGVFLAANFFDDFVEFHVDDILEVLISLGDADDAVTDFEASILVGGAAGDEFHDFYISILGAKNGSDAHEGELHGNLEILHFAGAHVVRVGVVTQGEGFEKGADLILALHFLHIFQKLIVAAGESFLRRAEFEFAEFLLQKLGLDAVAPELVGFSEVFRPGGFLAVEFDGAIALEVVFFCGEFFVGFDPALDAIEETLENFPRGAEIPAEDHVIELVAIFLAKLIHILLGEVEFVVIQEFEVAREEFGGHLVIQFLATVVGLLKPVGNGQRDAAFDLGVEFSGEDRSLPQECRDDHRQNGGFGDMPHDWSENLAETPAKIKSVRLLISPTCP